MDFISNKEKQIAHMKNFLGIESIDDLWVDIPKSLLQKPPTFDDGLSEFEGLRVIKEVASLNKAQNFDCYLGGGAYEHIVPSITNALISKSEFLTSYTQYQPEVSQGMLQAIFEYQSVMAAITGLDVSNASLYDAASGAAEAVMMGLRINENKKIVRISPNLNPIHKEVIKQYIKGHDIELIEDIHACVNTACILIQSPNYFGEIEPVSKIFEEAKNQGSITILSSNPLAQVIFKSSKELGADIAIGDLQPLGIPLQFGGPFAGFIVTRKEYMRELPGRIVGETIDKEGKRGFILTLQAREQHIRRAKATSNICSNQALMSLAALIGALWYGKEGLFELAKTNYQRANYLKQELSKLTAVQKVSDSLTFNEFLVTFKRPVDEVKDIFIQNNIIPGVKIDNHLLLVTVTETKSLEQLKRYIDVANHL
jgi:glycine dehydrogenase subunit 1